MQSEEVQPENVSMPVDDSAGKPAQDASAHAEAPVLESTPAVSPERLALRHLQGRMKKNLHLKRPVSGPQDEESSAASPEESEEERKRRVEAIPMPESRTGTPSEEARPALRNYPDDAAAPESRIITSPSHPGVQIERGGQRFVEVPTAIQFIVANPGFQTDDLIRSAFFQNNRPITVGVTSAVAGEGKTTVALRLAIDAVRGGIGSVCFMDMSLGEDTLSRRLGIDAAPGLVGVLEGRGSILSPVELNGYEGLSILPAEKAPDDGARVAHSSIVPEILNTAKGVFDVTIVDMPSITSGNVLPIALHLDAIVVVVGVGVTSKEIVTRALQRLDQSKVLALVLNRVKVAA